MSSESLEPFPDMPEKAPRYCHWDSHGEDVPLASQSELDFHLKMHFSDQIPENSGAAEVACHWDSCHEVLTLENMMEHWRTSHYQEALHPHYGAEECPEFDLTAHPSAFQSNSYGFVRVHGGITQQEPLSMDSLPALIPHTPADQLSSDNEFRCLWVTNGQCCGEVFNSTSDLKDHLESCHVPKGLSEYTCGWQGCDRCCRPFPQRPKLLRHLQVHSKHKEFKCVFCGRLFAQQCVLRHHMRTHSGEKPYTCDKCGKKFATHSSLTVHKRVHTGEKPLVCKWPGCNKRFAESSNLTKHMKTHVERAYACDICGRKFTRNDQLTRHYRVHLKSEPRVLAEDPSYADGNSSVVPATLIVLSPRL